MVDKKEKEKSSNGKEKEKVKPKTKDMKVEEKKEEEETEEVKGEDMEEKKEEEKSGTSFWTWVAGLVLVLVLVIAYRGFTGNAVFDGGEVKIGFMGPLSGDAASYGHGIKRGVELALKDSGLENVEVVYQDTKCDGKEAVSAINKFVSVDGVVAVVGEVCSGATLAAAPIAEENGVVMISASSTSPQVTRAGDYIFRTIPSDSMQGKFAAGLLSDNNVTKLAILYGNEEYGVGFKDVLTERFVELGGEVVASESFERGSVDLRTQITKIRQARPEAIFIISNSPDSAIAAFKQIKQLGVRAKLYGSEGLKGPEVENTEAANGLVVTSVSSGTDDFATKYMNEYGLEVEPFAPQAYDAFTAISRALKDGASSSEEIKEYLYTLEFDGISGDISFNSDGDVSGNYEVFKLENNSFVQIG